MADRIAPNLYSRHAPPEWLLRTDKADATLLFAGDLALHRWNPADAVQDIFGGVKEAFSSADFVAVNLETVLTHHDIPSGTCGRFIKAEPGAITCLEYLGVDAAIVANNHALDYGSSGLAESVAVLRRAGIDVCGFGSPHAETGILGATVHLVNGVRVGMFAATDHYGGVRPATSETPVWFDESVLRHAVRSLRLQCDVVVVQLHWGYEHVMYPLVWHRDFARTLVDDGADVVCCHHAHVVMGVERRGNGIIAYGLGNFWFGSQGRNHPASRYGLMLRVAVNRSGVLSAQSIPVSTQADRAVTVDALGSPGFDQLCSGLQSDGLLATVESTRATVELSTILQDIINRIANRDVAGLLERQSYLAAPRHDWLLTHGEERLPTRWGVVARWLRYFRSIPPAVIEDMALLDPPAVSRLARHADMRRLSGRWP